MNELPPRQRGCIYFHPDRSSWCGCFCTTVSGTDGWSRTVCLGLEGPAHGPGGLRGSSELPGWVQESAGRDGSSVFRPLQPGPQGGVATVPQSSHEMLGAVRKRWLTSGYSAGPGPPRDGLAGLGPELRHGTVLSPKLSGPHSPAWSQGPSRVPSGLSGAGWLGSPRGSGGGRRALPSSAPSDLGQKVFCTVGCLVVAREQ